MREAAFDELHGALEGDLVRREEQVDVVGHDDEGVEVPPHRPRAMGTPVVIAFVAVVLEGVEEELSCGGGFEEAVTIVGLSCDEEGAVADEACGLGHEFVKRTPGAKGPGIPREGYGTA